MAAKKGTGLLMVWADVPADKEPDFNRWYNEEHVAERMAVPGFLNDKSPELRRDAVARELDIIEKAARPSIKADLERLFAFTRDKDQVDLLAKKVAENGGKVSVTEHFGFVTHAALVGPFDNAAGKAFTTAYPPEAAADTSGSPEFPT